MKTTLIETFKHEAILHYSGKQKRFNSVQDAQSFVKNKKLNVEILHLHPAGINGKEKS